MDAEAKLLTALLVRVLAHIKKLDDCFGNFLVRVTCNAARFARSRRRHWHAWSAGQCPSSSSRSGMRCSQCGARSAEIVAVPLPRPRGAPKNPH
jgi:hypothetical protein